MFYVFDQGLIPAMQEVMPGVHHRFCAMHLWRNFTKQWKDKEMKNVVWECARARTIPEFNAKMDKLKAKNVQAWNYLNKWPKEAWTKAYFRDHPKIDNICNNACEAFNAKILKYRGKPILTLLEEVRCYIMRTVANNKMKLRGHQGMLPPLQQSRLEHQKEASNGWTPVWCGDGDGYEYQLQCWGETVGVHLSNGTCHCRFWQLTGMPCKHVVAACAHKNEPPENYCHAWLTMGAYRSTYEFYVHPTRSQQYWEPTDYVKPLPPNVPKRKAGRPKRKRRRDATEQQVAGGSRTRLRRTYPDITCTRCGLTGHNSRGCHRQGVSRMPRNWVPPPPEETENGEQTENGGQTENVDAQPGLQTEIDLSQSAPNEIDVSQPRHPAPEVNYSHNFTSSLYYNEIINSI